MKILTLAEFDPAGVHIRHRRHLRALGVDYRLAVQCVYRTEALEADYWLGHGVIDHGPDSEARWVEAVLRAKAHVADGWGELVEFAATADIVQVCPAIGQPWSFSTTEYRPEDELAFFWDGLPWRDLVRGRRVAVIHGSVNADANAERLARHLADGGFALAATTLDYVHRTRGKYLPAIVDITPPIAPMRKDRENLLVVHTPTDRRMCQTGELIARQERIGDTTLTVGTGLTLGACHELKRRHHAAVDHVRGSFSVNSLENAALGLVNLVGVRQEYEEYLAELHGVTLPWPRVRSMDDVERWLRILVLDAPLTRHYQAAARAWFERDWSPSVIAKRLLRAYEAMA